MVWTQAMREFRDRDFSGSADGALRFGAAFQEQRKMIAPARLKALLATFLILLALRFSLPELSHADIVPPEKLHPVAESYRRSVFILNLNPVVWKEVWSDMDRIASHLSGVDAAAAKKFREEIAAARRIAQPAGEEPDMVKARKQGSRAAFNAATRAVASTLAAHIKKAGAASDRETVRKHLEESRKIFLSFAEALPYIDPSAWREMQIGWLTAFSSLGTPGVLGAGARPMNVRKIRAEIEPIAEYFRKNFVASAMPMGKGRLLPRPAASPTYVKNARIPARLPPGANINKQLPRPRQLLGMAERGANESETGLIALGDMAFDSAEIFGEPARSLRISCNTCHNKGVTNPNFFIPGLSRRKGGMDVSNSFFEEHANNGIFGHLDTPDLRGIRFTAPYGRNGRTASLREFVRNVIVLEFNGSEPDPMLLDGMVAYMNEFEFIPNPKLKRSGRLNQKKASAAELRGEKIFYRKFPQLMGGMSCASCHIPSDHFLDRKSHNLGSAGGFAPGSLDGAFDTPTLLSAKYTAPYFHDGSLPTLRAVNEWFNRRFGLGLTKKQIDDLTAYVEAVGEGVDSYEDTMFTLDAELEEFSFFLSTYEFLKAKGKKELIMITLKTVATEIQGHKWDVQDQKLLPVLNKMESLIREAAALHAEGKTAELDAKLAAYRAVYGKYAAVLK